MKIQEFIREQFNRRLDTNGCLVIYDGAGRYRACALALAGESCSVLDAGESIIAGREQALAQWLKMARPGKSKQHRQLVIYVPAPKPESDEDKCRDPFQIFALGGPVFPEGDGDSYLRDQTPFVDELRKVHPFRLMPAAIQTQRCGWIRNPTRNISNHLATSLACLRTRLRLSVRPKDFKALAVALGLRGPEHWWVKCGLIHPRPDRETPEPNITAPPAQ